MLFSFYFLFFFLFPSVIAYCVYRTVFFFVSSSVCVLQNLIRYIKKRKASGNVFFFKCHMFFFYPLRFLSLLVRRSSVFTVFAHPEYSFFPFVFVLAALSINISSTISYYASFQRSREIFQITDTFQVLINGNIQRRTPLIRISRIFNKLQSP